MNILTIDTSTNCEIVSATDGDSFSSQSKIITVSHSQTLFDNIEIVLKELNLSINQVELIGVGIGPGSFTGIRIAVSSARMLAQVLNIPLVGIPTPQIFATALPVRAGEQILIAFDAKKGRVFGSLYKATADEYNPQIIVKPGDYFLEDIMRLVDPSIKLHTYGDGILKYSDIVKNSSSQFENIENFIPAAKEVCCLTKSLYEADPEKYRDIKLTIPDYTRKSDAEVAKLLREARQA